MLELSFLLFSIIIVICLMYYNNIYNKSETEGFKDNDMFYLSACPSGYKSFYQSDGDISCCNGDMIGNKCLGTFQCTLNGNDTPNMPNCVKFILNEYKEKGKSQCPATMSSYFEDNSKKKKGCTEGALNSTLTGPNTDRQPTCVIYSTIDQNINSKDSCYNQKQLDKFPCFGNNCTKQIIQSSPNTPPLLMIGFTDSTGMYRTAYTRKSLEHYLNGVNPNWKNQGMDLSKNIIVAEVAKAFYVDRTIQQSDIQI